MEIEKLFNVIDSEGNHFEATWEEAKENGYTVIVQSLQELEDHLYEDNTLINISFTRDDYEEHEIDEPFFYEDEPILPDDPEEGDEGYDDKMYY